MVIEYDTTTGASGGRRWREPSDLPAESLPSWDYLRRVSTALDASPALRRAMWRERRVKASLALEYGVGWDADKQAWVMPVWGEWGELVNCTRRPVKGHTMRWKGRDIDHPMRLAGRTAERGELPLWPDPPRGEAGLHVAGEWDALAALQAGLPAFTGLLGCRWHSAWDEHVIGRRIAIAYDRGEEAAAARTAEQLRAAGAAAAWVVDLAPLGVDPNGGDLCDYFQRGGSPRQLCRVIKEARDDR